MGMSGQYSIADIAEALGRSRTVIWRWISGYGNESDRRRAREAGFDGCLVKPINFEELFCIFDRK